MRGSKVKFLRRLAAGNHPGHSPDDLKARERCYRYLKRHTRGLTHLQCRQELRRHG